MRQRLMMVDSFAGGGGASLGIRRACGREPDVAINHDGLAMTVHAANHPGTRHFTEDVWKVSPREVTQGRGVGLLWLSPDCKGFSAAKGCQPVEKHIRSLAWVAVKWAVEAKPNLIILENVREFQSWGPILPRWRCAACGWGGTEGQTRLLRKKRRCPRCEATRLTMTQEMIPDPDKKGITFKRFIGRLRNLGYEIEWRVLNAADYGAPTNRRRLFVVARRDAREIVWPEPTHGDPKKTLPPLKPWRTAAECIDWDLPCPSIFDRKRPLVEATMRRIAFGMKRYVLDNPKPFIVTCNHSGPEFRGQGLDQPMATLTASRDAHGIIVPYVARLGQTGGNGMYVNGVDEPVTTVTSKAEHILIAPTLVQTGYGEREGQAPRALDIQQPLGTVVTGGGKHALVAAFIAKHYGGAVGTGVDTPLPTTTVRGTQNQIVAANLVHLNHGEKQWSGVDEPMRTLTTGKHACLVYAFLTKFFGTAIGQPLDDPIGTLTTKDRYGLICVTINGKTYVIVDIGMRMLTPRELARCQGFPDSYVLPGDKQFPGSKSSAVALVGNSVCPQVAEALVAANYKSARVAMAV